MPKVPGSGSAPAKTGGETVLKSAPDTRPIIYKHPITWLCHSDGSLPGAKPAVTASKMKELLAWETEDQYKTRIKKEMNDVVASAKVAAAGFGDDCLLKDLTGQKIRCWNNTKNRPFVLAHALEIAQEILHSGPGLPPERRRWQWNGEAFIVGDRAQVLSGQHRGVGLILACQEWNKDKDKWKHIWPTEPTLDTNITFGVPELPHVLRTIENVMPRKLSDVFYTSDLFSKLNPADRKLCSVMLMSAVDLGWKRTGVETAYQTHGESVDFLDRHPKLLKCVKNLFDANKERKITLLRLGPGKMAALQYLFGCSESTSDNYYKGGRSEKHLDWSMWDKAHRFFVLLSSKTEKSDLQDAVTTALGHLVDEDKGSSGRQSEKHAIICRAWNLWSAGKKVTEKGLELTYGEDANGIRRLIEHPTVRGIDLGERTKVPEDAVEEEPAEEAVEAAKEEVKQVDRVKQMDANARKASRNDTK